MTTDLTTEPTFGQGAECRMCGERIRYVGPYWEHIGITPRHPALPVEDATADPTPTPSPVRYVVVPVTEAQIADIRAWLDMDETDDESTWVAVDEVMRQADVNEAVMRSVLRAADADARPLREAVAELMYYYKPEGRIFWSKLEAHRRDHWLREADATLRQIAGGNEAGNDG